MLSRRPHLRIPLISLASKATKSDELCEGRKIMWKEGTIGIPGEKEVKKEYIAAHYSIKVYDEPSKFGINHGKISKLQLKQNGEIVANYDRGWDIRPTTKEAEIALCILLNQHN